MADSLAAAGDYLRSASMAEQAAGGNAPHARALITWAKALALSGQPGHAVAAAERAIQIA